MRASRSGGRILEAGRPDFNRVGPSRSCDTGEVRRAFPVLALVGLAAVAVGVTWWAVRDGPSDEQQLRAIVTGAARAAEEKRIDDVVEAVSERFEGHGLDRRGVQRLVAAHVLRGTWVAVTITGDRIEVRGDAARARVDVLLSRSGKGTPLANVLPEQATLHRFDLRFARVDGRWRVVAATWRPIPLEEAAAGPPPLGE
jgi:hypothetical protein